MPAAKSSLASASCWIDPMPVIGIGAGRGLLYKPPVAGGALGLQTSLGAFYSLDNTLVDATGNMSDLTNNNSVTFSSPGGTLTAVTNAAIFASASSQYLSVAAASAINMGSTSFSVQLWYYNTGGGGAIPINKRVGFGNGDFQTSSTFTGGASAVNWRSQSDTGTVCNSGNLSQNTWHHYVYTYNSTGNAQFLYVDGSQVDTNTGGSVPSGTGNLHIGANNGPGSYVDGRIALVGLWKGRVLSSSDVTALYNSGAGLSYAAMA
jgi:hypothetical protein